MKNRIVFSRWSIFLKSILFFAAATLPAGAAAAHETAQLEPGDSEARIIEKAASVTPSQRQIDWQRTEFAAFFHFGVNTFTNREWGDGKEDPAIFNPEQLDAKQWIKVAKQAGMKQVILTAKHHDGFCLWPSAYTEHSVKNSPWRGGKGDVVKEVADAAREAGIKFGVYLSPWDRHEETYGTAAYNDYYKNQLRELLTNYGVISEVWMDGACGDGDKRCESMPYDWKGIFELVRELQPDAVISISGPDVRWVGNEAGRTRGSEWSVLPQSINATGEDLGSLSKLKEAAERGESLRWYPAQVDTSIRPGWFYHKFEDFAVRSPDVLQSIYFNSVGGNTQLLLNIPPDKRGLIAEYDAKPLRKLGQYISKTFDLNLAHGAKAAAKCAESGFGAAMVIDGDEETFWKAPDGCAEPSIEIGFAAKIKFDVIMLQEHIASGQRIEKFAVDVFDGASWKEIAAASTVGYKRLIRVEPVEAEKARIRILGSRLGPVLAEIGFYATPDIKSTQ